MSSAQENKDKLLIGMRFDIESFCYISKEKGCSLYPAHRRLFDQTEIIREIVNILDKHKACGIFAVEYDIIKNMPEMMQPVLDSKGDHELTYHLHPAWDYQLQDDYGKPLSSCFMADYADDECDEMMDLAEKAFQKAYGFLPRLSIVGNASTSTSLVRAEEERGYLVQSNYTPNTDYRVYEKLIEYNFDGRRPFAGGPSAPLYPYAVNNVYRPHKAEGMLLGDMNPVHIPISQIEPGEGIACDAVLVDLEKAIEAIERAHLKKKELSSFALVNHTFLFVSGPRPEDIDTDQLQKIDRVLSFVDKLEDCCYCNFSKMREKYLLWEKENMNNFPWVRDALNGVMYYDGRQSVTFNACGVVGRRPRFSICQENGIAEWLVDGLHLGPLVDPKKEWNVLTRPSILSSEIIVNENAHRSYNEDLAYEYNKTNMEVAIDAKTEGMESIYSIRQDSIALKTAIDQDCTVIHRLHLNPDFDNVILGENGSILIENKKNRKVLNIKSNAEKVVPIKEASYSGLRLCFNAWGGPYTPFETVLEIKEMNNG